MKSSKEFLEFVSKNGRTLRLFGLIMLGLILILIGTRGGEKSAATVPTDESRIEEICSMIEGVGECRVMMTYQDEGESVYAVLVLCEGADSTAVRQRITSALRSLYGIGAHRVEIQRLTRQP